MSKYITKDFMSSLQVLLAEFRKYQLDNNEPYNFDLLGLMDWLESEKEVDTLYLITAPKPKSEEKD